MDTARKKAATIFHAVTLSELRAGLSAETYTPARFAEDGFVHCSAGRDVTLAVANDYFADPGEPLLLLALDPSRLSAELRYEAPAPIAGGGEQHLEKTTLFPHVYGPIDRAAVAEAAVLESTPNGYRWPRAFQALEDVIAEALSQPAR